MRIPQIAELIEANHQTIVNWLKDGKIPYTREGKIYEVEELDFLNFIYDTKYAYRYERNAPERWSEYLAYLEEKKDEAIETKWLQPIPFANLQSTLKTTEIANLLQIKERRVLEWIWNERLASTKHGDFHYVAISEFQRFLRENPRYNIVIGEDGIVDFSLLPEEQQLAFISDRHEVDALELANETMESENRMHLEMIQENKKRIKQNQTLQRKIKIKYANLHFKNLTTPE